MPNQFPYIVNRRVDPLPLLGWDWETFTEVRASDTNEITERTFSEPILVGGVELAQVDAPPKGYPFDDVTKHYLVSQLLHDNRYNGKALIAANPEDPAYAENDFYGWRKTTYHYYLDVVYTNKVSHTITWRPALDNTGKYTANYILEIKTAEGTLVTSSTQLASSTEVSIQLKHSAVAVSQSSAAHPNISVYNVSTPSTSTSGLTNIVDETPLFKPYLKLTKPTSVFTAGTTPTLTNPNSITLNIHGVEWGGDLRFANYVTETELLLHPQAADLNTRLKPPGKQALNAVGNTTPIGSPLESGKSSDFNI